MIRLAKPLSCGTPIPPDLGGRTTGTPDQRGMLVLYRVPDDWVGQELSSQPPEGSEIIGVWEVPADFLEACRDAANAKAMKTGGRVWCVSVAFTVRMTG